MPMQPTSPLSDRAGVFVSYSHKDKVWRDRLRVVLKPVLSGERLWDDTRIVAGERWERVIEDTIASVRVAVLLVTANFLASDFITSEELPRIIERQNREGLTIIWVAAEPAMYDRTVLAAFQAANDPTRPLSTLRKPARDAALVHIAEQIVAAADINAIGQALRVIDELEPQLKAFIDGTAAPSGAPTHGVIARQRPGEATIVAGPVTITPADLAKLDKPSRQFIRAHEREMKVAYERWLALQATLSGGDSKARRAAQRQADESRLAVCSYLNTILDFLDSLNKNLPDHYSHARYLCGRPAAGT